MIDTDLENLEPIDGVNSDLNNVTDSGLQTLFNYVSSIDWSKVSDEEVAIASAEAKELLGF